MNSKVIIIGTTASGILGFRKDIIKSLTASGHKVYAFAINYTDEQKAQVVQLGAIPEEYTLNRTGMNPLADLLATLRLAKKINKIKPDLVFSYFSKPVIFGTLAARLAGVKKIFGMLEGLGYTFTNQPEGLSKKAKLLQSVQILLYKLSFRFLDKVIFLNPDDPKDLVIKNNIKVKKFAVLGGIGLDLKQYPYIKPSQKAVSFIFIGRLLKEKGINEFITAAKLVKVIYPDVIFTVLGGLDEGNPGGLQKNDIELLVSTGVIDYLGQVTNVAERIAQASVFVLPSYREGVPRSTQEAMAIGRPVITTDMPGCRETVVDGVNGFLVKPWDPQALAEKMIYFIENPDQIETMGLESYRMAQEKFDAEKVNKKLMGLLGL
ncbi:glycosyltransferase family 4 protein [Oceanisphaera pacifica]|uniref:Glycosyltransferase family 4 protein n=1 Tax=Oceanisphaera pacifica TaxID=2818389 RepID=A0ABS3NGK6_9GAMM|nr:glycosyltransferase family 4 protein [Oceanisphaera pacifica]MBO1519731.1 glycosyltransferase family 4 protein [Oceanisphaera pacifica]